MAFNPFHAFQKNKIFWMAAVLLTTMITFIFCMGKGGMEDRILHMFLKRGTAVVTIGSYQLSNQDLYQLRADRNMVNEYMMKCTRIAADHLAKLYDEEAKKPLPADDQKAKERKAELVKIVHLQATLIERLRHPRFFEGGVKLDDLIEFKTWQTQADRLGIKILDDELEIMVKMQFLVAIHPQQMLEAQAQARGSKDVSDAQFRRALMEEFRVRLARLAMIEAQVARSSQSTDYALIDPNRPDEQRDHVTLAQLWKVFQDKRSEMDVTLIPVHVDDFTKEVFAQKPPTDAELDKLYQQYKTEKYFPASPLPSFESPMEVKVEYVMADPTSPKYLGAARAVDDLLPRLALLGSPLQSPTVAAVRAGALAAGKQKIAEDVLAGMSQPRAFELYGTADLGGGQFIWPMAAYFAQREPRAIASLVGNATASLGNPGLPGVPAWAGFLGEVSVPTKPGNAPAPASHEPEIDAGIAIEAKRRTVPYATVAGSGAIGQPAGMAAAAFLALKLQSVQGNLYSEQLFLPTPIIERELWDVIESRTAEQRASRNLLAVKKLLDKSTNPQAVRRVINEAVPKYELTHVVTKRYYNRYDIDKAPELRALRDAYEKYYQQIDWLEKRDINPERLLKETDFDKLFFDNESFSSTGKYQVRPWPPEVQPNPLQVRTMPGAAPDMPGIPGDVLADVQRAMQQQEGGQTKRYSLLDKAQKPILFWQIDTKPAAIPHNVKVPFVLLFPSLQQPVLLALLLPSPAHERVVAAWKLEKARELKAIPTAKKIAYDLLPASGDYTSEVLRKASELGGRAPVDLPHVAPLVPKDLGAKFGGRREYFPYLLPKDKVPLADPDMVADLLSLYDLKKPIEIKWRRSDGTPAFVKEINDLNADLFDKAKKEKKKGVFVQVLTNLPQNIYYVAVVRRPPTPDARDFADAILWASESPVRAVDLFVPRAQVVLAKEFHGELLKQIQRDVHFKDDMDAKDRAEFDKGADIGG